MHICMNISWLNLRRYVKLWLRSNKIIQSFFFSEQQFIMDVATATSFGVAYCEFDMERGSGVLLMFNGVIKYLATYRIGDDGRKSAVIAPVDKKSVYEHDLYGYRPHHTIVFESESGFISMIEVIKCICLLPVKLRQASKESELSKTVEIIIDISKRSNNSKPFGGEFYTNSTNLNDLKFNALLNKKCAKKANNKGRHWHA